VDEVVDVTSVALMANIISRGSVAFEPILTTVLVAVGFLAVVSRLGFKFINKVTGSIQKYGIEEVLLGFTLLLAFMLGGITESLKLASVLGVFIAGMILSRSAQYPIITRKVKEIGESFFIPIFFASVGLTINIFAASGQLYAIIAITLAIVALKLATSFTSLRLFSFPKGHSLKIGSGFLTFSEMVVVMASLAVAQLSQVFYVSIIAAFMLINVVSPLVMNYIFARTE
jgi:Kef-type K+ transport system membrane component KefB